MGKTEDRSELTAKFYGQLAALFAWVQHDPVYQRPQDHNRFLTSSGIGVERIPKFRNFAPVDFGHIGMNLENIWLPVVWLELGDQTGAALVQLS